MSREIDEELSAHIEEAIEQGRDPVEARRAFGSPLRQREASRDVKVVAWLDSLRADAVFGWRQIKKQKVTSAAAILSLGLAIGACTAAFRLIDALLLRPLPIAHPERLYGLSRQGINPEDGKPEWAMVPHTRCFARCVPQLRIKRISWRSPSPTVTGSDLRVGEEMEKRTGNTSPDGCSAHSALRPALGRLLTENDDLAPGAHPVAVLSYDYWTRRFGRDPKVIGRTFRIGNDLYASSACRAGLHGNRAGTTIDISFPP